MHQRRANTLTLLTRVDTDRSDSQSRCGIDVRTRGDNVSDDLIVSNGNE